MKDTGDDRAVGQPGRLQGEVSAFREQLADSHQDWEQIKVETHKLLSLQEQLQQELHRLKSLKATHRHIFICRAFRSMLYQVSVVAVILSLLALNAWQFKCNRSMSDNDLKYRTILMMGSAQAQDLGTLETIFEYDQDRKRIRA